MQGKSEGEVLGELKPKGEIAMRGIIEDGAPPKPFNGRYLSDATIREILLALKPAQHSNGIVLPDAFFLNTFETLETDVRSELPIPTPLAAKHTLTIKGVVTPYCVVDDLFVIFIDRRGTSMLTPALEQILDPKLASCSATTTAEDDTEKKGAVVSFVDVVRVTVVPFGFFLFRPIRNYLFVSSLVFRQD
jgi:hypothetical protein